MKVSRRGKVPHTPSTASSAGGFGDDENECTSGECNVLQELTLVSRRSPLFRFPSDGVVAKLAQLRVLPKCVVFDLDDTLWIGDVDCTYGPPFSAHASTSTATAGAKSNKSLSTPGIQGTDVVYDRSGTRGHPALRLFPEVFAILNWIESKHPDMVMAVASRTTEPAWAAKALSVLTTAQGTPLSTLVRCSECRNVNKQNHLLAISKKLQIHLKDMVFYDNLYYNISDVEGLPIVEPGQKTPKRNRKVVSVYTPRGLNWENFVEGLLRYQDTQPTSL